MKILLALDGSKGSQAVVQEAITRSWPQTSTFCVLSIVDLNRWSRVPKLIQDARHAAHKLVDAAVSQLQAAGFEAMGQVRLGFPQKAITKFASEWEADLVIVGSHGRSEVSRLLLGSVAQSVLRNAICAVEIVRSPSYQKLAGQPMKVLFATDGSECSTEAAMAIARSPWAGDTEFLILSALQLAVQEIPATWCPACPEYPTGLLEEIWKDAEFRAQTAITDARKVLRAAGLKVTGPGAPVVGDPRPIILDQAATWGADLIVMGSHGRHGFDRMFIGSVSESVAFHANCSVEVFRAPMPSPQHEDLRELSLMCAT